MSSSRLKPSVTPVTALAMRLRARPWNFASSGLSVTRLATRWPSLSSKLIPAGCAWRSLPFGPCTSTAPSTTVTVTPLGIVIGFLPIRDIVFPVGAELAPPERADQGRPLPNVAQQLTADAGLHGCAAGHHAARGRQDAGAETGEHLRHVIASEIDAAARPADALDAGDQLLAMRPVFQEQPQRLDRR